MQVVGTFSLANSLYMSIELGNVSAGTFWLLLSLGSAYIGVLEEDKYEEVKKKKTKKLN